MRSANHVGRKIDVPSLSFSHTHTFPLRLCVFLWGAAGASKIGNPVRTARVHSRLLITTLKT